MTSAFVRSTQWKNLGLKEKNTIVGEIAYTQSVNLLHLMIIGTDASANNISIRNREMIYFRLNGVITLVVL